MKQSNRNNFMTSEHSRADRDRLIPDVSFLDFLDGLPKDTLKLVALIMSENTGQKNILHQLNLHESI